LKRGLWTYSSLSQPEKSMKVRIAKKKNKYFREPPKGKKKAHKGRKNNLPTNVQYNQDTDRSA